MWRFATARSGAPAVLECHLVRVVDLLGDGNRLAVGEVTGIHLRDDCLRDGRFDVTVFRPVARMGYRDYTVVREVIEVLRPGDESFVSDLTALELPDPVDALDRAGGAPQLSFGGGHVPVHDLGVLLGTGPAADGRRRDPSRGRVQHDVSLRRRGARAGQGSGRAGQARGLMDALSWCGRGATLAASRQEFFSHDHA